MRKKNKRMRRERMGNEERSKKMMRRGIRNEEGMYGK